MKRIALFFICISLIMSCKKNTTDNSTSIDSTISVDYLSDEQLQILDNAGIDTTTKFSDLLFPDGTKIIDWEKSNDSGYPYVFKMRGNPASDKKQLFIGAMMHAADKLTNKDSFKIITNQKNGLAYVFGSRHLKYPAISTKQDNGDPAVCQMALYGLDCNGMIYQMATASGLNLKEGGTTEYSKVETWSAAIIDPNSSDFNGLQMTDLKNLDWNLVQAGDIVVSIGSHNHIGMIYDNGKFKGMMHSHGSPGYTCDKNTGIKRGPVKTPQLLKWVKEMFGTNYHILRVAQYGIPGLSTTKITSITDTTAVSGGNITNDGGSSITAKGVCWSILPYPTVSLPTKTNDGAGKESFTSNITGLAANHTYHVRAYATNSAGTAYGREEGLTTTKPIEIGDFIFGGTVFHIDSSGKHGLVAAPNDASFTTIWGCHNTFVSGAQDTTIGSGQKNTNAILSTCPEQGIAARYCDTLNTSGYDDWFLPSYSELIAMGSYRDKIGNFLYNGQYWSSSQGTGIFTAFGVTFSFVLLAGDGDKEIPKRVRAVRKF